MSADDTINVVEKRWNGIAVQAAQKYLDTLNAELPKSSKMSEVVVNDRGASADVSFGLTSGRLAKAFATAASHMDMEMEKAFDEELEKFIVGLVRR